MGSFISKGLVRRPKIYLFITGTKIKLYNSYKNSIYDTIDLKTSILDAQIYKNKFLFVLHTEGVIIIDLISREFLNSYFDLCPDKKIMMGSFPILITSNKVIMWKDIREKPINLNTHQNKMICIKNYIIQMEEKTRRISLFDVYSDVVIDSIDLKGSLIPNEIVKVNDNYFILKNQEKISIWHLSNTKIVFKSCIDVSSSKIVSLFSNKILIMDNVNYLMHIYSINTNELLTSKKIDDWLVCKKVKMFYDIESDSVMFSDDENLCSLNLEDGIVNKIYYSSSMKETNNILLFQPDYEIQISYLNENIKGIIMKFI